MQSKIPSVCRKHLQLIELFLFIPWNFVKFKGKGTQKCK